jgi:hypothetical protein
MEEATPKGSELYASALVGMSWRFARSNLPELMAIALAPGLLSLFIGIGASTFNATEFENSFFHQLVAMLDVVPWTLFGVALHRRILQNSPATIRSSISWSRSHSAFAAFLLFWQLTGIIGVEFLSALKPESSFGGAWIIALMVLGILLGVLQAKFSLFLPATAISDRLSPGEAWRRSTGYVGAIFWSAILSACLAFLLISPFFLVTVFLPSDSSTVMNFISLPGSLIFEALAVGSLSFAYRRIVTNTAATQLHI